MVDIKKYGEIKKITDEQIERLNQTIVELKAKIKQNDLTIVSLETKSKMLEEVITRLNSSSSNLEGRLAHETESLTQIRICVKKLEKENTNFKLSYEAQKEQYELIKKENDILVFLDLIK